MSRYYDLKAASRQNALLLCVLALSVVGMFYLIFGLEHIYIGLLIAVLVVSPILWDAYRAFRYSMPKKE